MRCFRGLLLLPLTLVSYVHAQNSTAILQAAIKELPECALNCMVSAVAKSSCTLSDFYCISRDEELNDNMSVCVYANCTIKEALTAKNFSQTAYGAPIRDHTKLISYAGMIGGGFALLAVILRMFARLPCCGGTWGWDDWGILVAMVPIIPLTVLSVPLANHGLGKDIWTVPFNNITTILHIYYFDELFYLSSIALTKISILLFYLRIFPNKNFRQVVYVTIGLCAGYAVSFVTATALQCIPVRIAWLRWDGEHHGKCINLNLEGWLTAAINIILDVIVISLPLRELSKLAMSRRKKAGIMLMFIGGGFVTIVSMLRLKWMIQFANSQNVTWDYTPIGYWSTLEVHVGIIIACLPALRSLQHRLFPSSRSPNSYYRGPSGGYGYNSKGGSPFPSIVKNKKGHVDLMTAASQASMIRTRDRKGSDKEFIQLEEYEVRLGSGGEDMDKSAYFRGMNDTQIERGSVHTDDAVLLPIQRTPSSTPPQQPSKLSKSSPLGEGSQIITVRKDYSVTVEISPEQLNPTPPRGSEELGSRRQSRIGSASHSPTRGVAPKRSQSQGLGGVAR